MFQGTGWGTPESTGHSNINNARGPKGGVSGAGCCESVDSSSNISTIVKRLFYSFFLYSSIKTFQILYISVYICMSIYIHIYVYMHTYVCIYVYMSSPQNMRYTNSN